MVCAAVGSPCSSFAQEAFQCGQEESPSQQAGGGTIRDIADDNKALIIFARFPDAEQVNAAGNAVAECADCGDGWAVGTASDSVPAWADSLICPSIADSVAIPGSLTHYFYEMSGGQHFLTGDVLDTVITTDSTLAQYHAAGSGFSSLRRANRDVLLKADSLGGSWDIDFSDYDGDGDGIVDYVFIYWQSVRMYDEAEPDSTKRFKSLANNASAISNLLNEDLVLDNDNVTLQGGNINNDSGATIWNLTSPGLAGGAAVDVRHRWAVATVMAHEYGHDLMPFAGYGGSIHFRTASRYSLMQGYGKSPVMLMSALLRYKLWFKEGGSQAAQVIHFPGPGEFPHDATVTLGTSYRDGKHSMAVIRTADPEDDQYFVLEARASNLPGDTYNAVHPDNDCCLPAGVVGDGLLISHVAEAGGQSWQWSKAPILGIETATGKFDSTTGAPDPVHGVDLISMDPYAQGENIPSLGSASGKPQDPYKHWLTNTFAPFTNPSSNLYKEQSGQPLWEQSVYSGITVHDIKLIYNQPTDGLADSISFKVRIDDPTNPPVDADTVRVNDMVWRGTVQLTGDLVVESGKNLWLADGCRVIAAADTDRFGGGVDSVRTEMGVNGAVHLQGTTSATSSRDTGFSHWFPGVSTIDSTISGELEDPAPADWYGWRFTDVDSDLTGEGLSMKYARAAIADENPTAAWPDLAALDDAITFSSNVADVGFDRDHTVVDSLRIPPAMRIGFSPTDAGHPGNGGVSPKCELIVPDDARLVAVGSPTAPVVIDSTNPDTTAEGDWLGIRMLAMAESETGYGFTACTPAPQGCSPADFCSDCDAEKSEFKDVVIAGADKALSIEGNLLPEITDASFRHITGDRHIYLNGDAVLPIDFEWHLKAPTHIVAADTPYTSIVDHTYGTVDRIDALLEGTTYTDRDAGSSDSVKFRPEVESPSTADNWGGVFLGAHSTHVLKYADIGYAENPLFVDWAGWDGATATIRHSSIHHFGDVGLWIHGTYGDGWVAFVDSCSVFRGDDLDRHLGRVGVLLDAAEAVAVTDNTISIENDSGFDLVLNGSRALEVYFPAGLCDSTPPFFDCTLTIDGNDLFGPGEDEGSQYTGTSGIFANYVCGRTDREVNIFNNWIRDFNYSGLEFSSSRDIQIQCNRVEANQQAVEFRREEEATGAGLRFRTNYLEVDADRTGLIRTENALKTKLGPVGLKGDNELRTHGVDDDYTKFILEDELGNSHPALNARSNRWFKNDSLVTDSTDIFTPDFIWTTLPDSISSNWPLVDVGNPDTTLSPTQGCWPQTASRLAGGPGHGWRPGGEVAESDGRSERPAGIVPTVTVVGPPFPNPARDVIRFDLAVSPDHAGRYRVAAYDVAGRVVAVLADRPVVAGRYRLEWQIHAARGGATTPGVYFLRVSGPGIERNSKVVVIR